ncbi:MAG TPA: hypothetical protein VIM48_01315 [Chthoniobacterales bacterium]
MLSLRLSAAALTVATALGFSTFASAAPPTTVTIPLVIRNVSDQAGPPEYKLGISLSLGGGPFKLYEFDTGAPGLYASYNSQWWPGFSPTGVSFSQTYSSGITYTGQIVATRVDLGNGIPAIQAKVGQIDSASGTKKVKNWNQDVADGKPPLYGYFFGDFGMSLGTGNGLYAIVPQLPGNLSSGFIVTTGGYQNPHPRLYIGLTEDMRSQFTSLVPMLPPGGKGLYPGKHPPRHVYQAALINTTMSIRKGGLSADFKTPVVLDTGAPIATIRDVNGGFAIPAGLVDSTTADIVNGADLEMHGARADVAADPWIMKFVTGPAEGYNEVAYTTEGGQARTGAYVNAGLTPYFRYDVMFDIERGVVGFRPVVYGGPSIRVKGSRFVTTNAGSVTVRGTAIGRADMLASIQYRVNKGPWKSAAGLTTWKFGTRIPQGQSTIDVRVTDEGGVTARQTVWVTRL